jgi:primosomal protein N'
LVPRVRNKYIMDCLVKMPRHAAHLQHVKSKLFEIKQGVAHQKQLSNVQIVIDVDPM